MKKIGQNLKLFDKKIWLLLLLPAKCQEIFKRKIYQVCEKILFLQTKNVKN